MGQPSKWWRGLLPLALVWMVANWQKTGPIAADIQARAEAAALAIAGRTPGIAPLTVSVAGRDVMFSGELPSTDLSPPTLRAADLEFGVRMAAGQLRPAQPQRPYGWTAQRDAGKLTLSGFVPDQVTKAALVAAAAAAFPGAQVDDQQRIAFGAPSGFSAAAAWGLAEIGKLAAGKIALTDSGLCIEGSATTSDSFLDLSSRTAVAPPGFSKQACTVNPPTVVPYGWSAAKAASGAITLSGFYPSDSVRADINTAVKAAAPGAVVTDGMKPALGAPASLLAMVNAGMAQLSRMVEGSVSLAGTVVTVSGRGPSSFEACDALRSALAGQVAPGFSLGSAAIECPPPPPPPPPPPAVLSWSATKTDGGIVLSGMAPTMAAKGAAASSALISTIGTVTDNVQVQANIDPNPDYASATNFALAQLALLNSGLAWLDGPALVVTGEAPTTAAKAAIDAALSGALPGGVRLGRADITVSPQPAPAPAPVPASATVAPVPSPPAPVVVAPPPPPPPPPPAPAVISPPPPPPPAAVALVWRAVKTNDGLTLSGLVPSAEARATLVGAARLATSGRVSDAMAVQGNIANGTSFGAVTAWAVTQLERLTSGEVSVSGPALVLRGIAPTPEAKAMVDAASLSLPAGTRLAEANIIVRPYDMEAQADRSGLVLSGYVPDATTRADLVAAAEAAGFAGKIRDELRIVGGAPANFGAAARLAVSNLLRLDLGTARVNDQSIMVQGMSCRDVIKQEVETGASSGLPTGFRGSGQVSIRQTGCTNCQLELDTATRDRKILFRQSRDDLATDEGTIAVLAEVTRVLEACPTARIAVEGHTNFDGERRGYPNKALSERRSRVVIDALVARGLAAGRLTPIGFGPEKPLIPHGAATARELNRRVQFTIVNP